MNLIGQQPMGQLPGQQFMNTGQQIPGVMAPVGVPVMNFGGGVDPQQQLQAMAVQNMMGLPTGMQGLVGRGRGRNMDRGNRQNNRRDSGLSREVEAIGATLNNLGNDDGFTQGGANFPPVPRSPNRPQGVFWCENG